MIDVDAKVFSVNTGGTTTGIEERVEKELNKLLDDHPGGIEIEHVTTMPTSSGKMLIVIFYSKKEAKDASK